MDVKLESLIEKIKKEGVEEARKQAEQILKEAQAKEKEIIQRARQQAEKIKGEGEKEAKKFKESAEESLKQAARDLIISVREKLTGIFDNILKQELNEALGPEVLADILQNLINKWSQEKEKGFEVLVSRQDQEKLKSILLSRLKDKAASKIEIKSSPSIRKGFQIGIKGEDTYYDFSDDGIIEALSVFLNPRLSSLISGKKDG